MSRKIKFITGCPVQTCLNSNLPIYWNHGMGEMKYASKSDRYHNNLYIYEDGTIECQDCLNKDIIINWKFKCGAHDFLFPSSSPKTMIEVLHSLEADLYFIDNCLEAFAKKRTEFFLNI